MWIKTFFKKIPANDIYLYLHRNLILYSVNIYGKQNKTRFGPDKFSV